MVQSVLFQHMMTHQKSNKMVHLIGHFGRLTNEMSAERKRGRDASRRGDGTRVGRPVELESHRMTRGDQRERARQKRAKEDAKKKKGNTEALTLQQRQERDAAILRQKQQAAMEKKAAQA